MVPCIYVAVVLMTLGALGCCHHRLAFQLVTGGGSNRPAMLCRSGAQPTSADPPWSSGEPWGALSTGPLTEVGGRPDQRQ